ncbi:4-galactosyl-N-acetylglucosaminide 3-alpha-L-fucosyltransferase FUT6-like [Pseudophryne corroboree]|uniref:4-galactosyl-N-acetylglucosaminide 3-alpha-L-fucosyltransferase FUT6-like n=1 Tax=Pseudophryne corroboree TaxID=495146 RepID=UPI0030815095
MENSGSIFSMKKCFMICIAQLCLAVILFILYNNVSHSAITDAVEHVETTREPAEHTQIILLWTWPFGDKFPLNKCPSFLNSSGCFYTDNRTLFFSADVVVIHHWEVRYSQNQLPQMPRPPNQYWVWFNLEPPSHSPNLQFMDNLINLTMSYRADSDIFSPYGWLEENKEEENFTIPSKTKLVAWAVSNWNPNSRRVRYYNQLKNYLSVDIYGRQHKPLPRNEHQQTLSKYKFYLAFENSAHEDYITEKLWNNAFANGIVPVVMGPSRGNYERFIPKDSFIHVDDFPTAQELATYILKLDSDDKAYQQYFHWRSRLHPFAGINWQTAYCRVCKAIKEAPKHKTIPSLGDWYK